VINRTVASRIDQTCWYERRRAAARSPWNVSERNRDLRAQLQQTVARARPTRTRKRFGRGQAHRCRTTIGRKARGPNTSRKRPKPCGARQRRGSDPERSPRAPGSRPIRIGRRLELHGPHGGPVSYARQENTSSCPLERMHGLQARKPVDGRLRARAGLDCLEPSCRPATSSLPVSRYLTTGRPARE